MRRSILALCVFILACEWFYYGSYWAFSADIDRLYFPFDAHFGEWLSIIGIVIGYCARPIGAFLLAPFADRRGRIPAMKVAVSLSAIPTIMMAILPTYHQWGETSSFLMILLRLLQGVSLGAVAPAGQIYLSELAPPKQRTYVTSFYFVSVATGACCAILLLTGVTTALNTHSLHQWGWRIPSIISIVLTLLSIVFVFRLPESPLFIQHQNTLTNAPSINSDHADINRVKNYLHTFLFVCVACIPLHLSFSYLPKLFAQFQGVSALQAHLIDCANLLIASGLAIMFGKLGDRHSRKTLLNIGLMGVILFSLPMFYLVSMGQTIYTFLGQFLLTPSVGLFGGVYTAIISEQHITASRFFGYTASNLSYAIAGGSAPIIAHALTQKTGIFSSPAYYLIFISLLGFLVVRSLSDKRGMDIQ